MLGWVKMILPDSMYLPKDITNVKIKTSWRRWFYLSSPLQHRLSRIDKLKSRVITVIISKRNTLPMVAAQSFLVLFSNICLEC